MRDVVIQMRFLEIIKMKFILSRKAAVQFLWFLSATAAPGFSLINKDTVFFIMHERNLLLLLLFDVIKFQLEMFFVPHFLFRF